MGRAGSGAVLLQVEASYLGAACRVVVTGPAGRSSAYAPPTTHFFIWSSPPTVSAGPSLYACSEAGEGQDRAANLIGVRRVSAWAAPAAVRRQFASAVSPG